jgi:hypothetical protein
LNIPVNAALALLGSLAVGACVRHAPAPPRQAATTAQAAPATGCLATHDGYLRVRLRGAENVDISWRDSELQCDGGPRPDGRGIRLTFAGPKLPGGHQLRFVFGIAGAGQTGQTGEARDLPANVTVIFEGEPRLYSTRGEDKCTIDQLTAARAPASQPTAPVRVAARGFCVAPAAAADGGAGLLLSRFDFAGSVSYESDDTHAAAAPPT